ncbi:hypothetical protein [Sorangium sp. So ce131]|uniref:hypothetical protein n=1 Tax=Sorangium sp. So ce131 TaxID=3133282 RepID=UPI003F5FC6F4
MHLRRCGRGGIGAVALAEAAGGPRAIALDATHVYWTHLDTDEIMKAPIAGGAAVTIAHGCPSYGIAVNAANVYWTCTDPVGVFSAPLGGGTPTLLSTGLEEPLGIALDATSIYVGDSYAVRKLPIGGGEAEWLALGTGARRVQVDATHVYWTNADASSVRKVPIAGGDDVVLASGYFESHEVVLDATHVYWANLGDAPEIRRVPVDGGEPVVVIAGVAPRDLAVDGTSIYWTDESGFVMKLAK